MGLNAAAAVALPDVDPREPKEGRYAGGRNPIWGCGQVGMVTREHGHADGGIWVRRGVASQGCGLV